MPSFTYTARNRSGATVTDAVDAPTRKDALRLLTARGLTPVHVSEATARPTPGKRKTKSASASLDARPSSLAPKLPQAASLSASERLPFLEALVDLTTSGGEHAGSPLEARLRGETRRCQVIA